MKISRKTFLKAAAVAPLLPRALAAAEVKSKKVEKAAIKGTTDALTAFDRDAIRIVYQRPPGNRSPDIDPPAYVIN